MSDPTVAQLRAARREITISSIVLIASCVVLFLASRAGFRSMMHFPLVFAVIVSLVAVVSLLTARRVAWKPRLVLALAIIGVSALAPFVHLRAILAQQRAYDRRAMELLGGKAAPTIPFVSALGMEGQQPGAVAPGGQVTLVNFWASWCDPCVREVPMLEAFWAEHRAAGLLLLGVTKLYGSAETAESELRSIEEFRSEHGVSYPILIGGQASPAHEAYQVVSLPSSVLIDSRGIVVGFGTGIDGTMRLMEQARRILRSPSARDAPADG